jgi:hypothetical protein
MKTIIRPVYIALRLLFYPLLLLFRPIGMRPESVVATSFLAVIIFVVQPFTAARFGGGYSIIVTTIGAILGYAFLVWGKEFEGNILPK